MNFVLVKLKPDLQPDWNTAQLALTLDEAKAAARSIGIGRILVYRMVAEVEATCVMQYTEVPR